MSRNFDLLAEVERERETGADNHRVPVSVDRSAVKVDFPVPAGEDQGAEISRLVRSIFLVNNGTAPRKVVFLGVDSESGSSLVCANAARSLVRNTSKPVCLVDANVESARLSRLMGVTKPVAFSAKLSSVREQCAHVGGNLWLAGIDLMSDGRGALLPFDELKHRFIQLSSAFEYLLVDAPGTAVSQDAEIVGSVSEAAVLVVEANKTRRADAARAKEALDAAGVRLLGTVLNDRTFPIPQRLEKFV